MTRLASMALVVAGLSVGATLNAAAADIPLKAAPMPVVAVGYNWTGIYVGVNGGYAWGTGQWTYTTGAAIADQKLTGGLVGGTVGFNYQMGQWVWGVEADWDWARLKGSSPCPNPAFSCDIKIDSIGTARGRVGYAQNAWLLYGTGGFAWARTRAETVNLAGLPIAPSGSPVNGSAATPTGWTAGVGLEYALMGNWSAKVEYLYVKLNSNRYAVDSGLFVDAQQRASIIRAGLNYRFNWMR